jgi:flavin reductase (DIM6/NTAB) family NADH-FMN oxidoreductase RutF
MVDQAAFRSVLGSFTSGVTIVTTCHNEQLHGITVSSFCSLSLEPPLVLVCIDNRCRSADLIKQASVFAVNILAEDGEWLSRQFASRAEDKFANVAYYYGETGVPLLQQALAVIECQLVNKLPGGDHTIFVGQVIAAHANDQLRPLVYQRSRYHQLAEVWV